MPETVDVFRNRTTGLYLIQRNCPHPELRGPTSIGLPEVLTKDEMIASGLEKLKDALASSLKPCTDASQIQVSSENENLGFCKEHDCVTVVRWADANGRIEVRPLRQVRGGYRGIPEEKLIVEARNIDSGLIDCILRAFEAIGRRRAGRA